MNWFTATRRKKRLALHALGQVSSASLSTMTVIQEGGMTHRVAPVVLQYWQAPRVTKSPALVADYETQLSTLKAIA